MNRGDLVICSGALTAGFSFNIDPKPWKSFRNSAAGFGYQVVQRKSDLLVSAPLEQYSPVRRGQVYRCSDLSCRLMQLHEPEFAVNMSLGLTMTSDPSKDNTMVCGPTIPKDCKSITMLNGACIQIDRSNRNQPPVPSSIPVCRAEADIAYLLDGSGSVTEDDFIKMKTFVKDLTKSIKGPDTQFAVAQFASVPEVHYYFDNFFSTTSWERNIDRIIQMKQATYTARAINFVVQEIFAARRGSRPNVKKVLIVITDGISHDKQYLQEAAAAAERKGIVRFVIGVGSSFLEPSAKLELDTIASLPSKNYVFQVDSFTALESIKNNLREKIFAIEGTKSGGHELKMEMAQEGFSAAYVPQGIQMGVVGANQWRGGYLKYSLGGHSVGSYKPEYLLPDSYFGYSMAVASTPRGMLTIAGVPRYKHRGVVMVVQESSQQKVDPFPWKFQIGEYFGAVVCAMDINLDSYTDIILISSPMYKDTDREGRVYACPLNGLNVECRFDNPLVLRGDESEEGRFGSSVAVLPDLNTDGLRDVAVGAPLENDGQGCVYIFNGEGGARINPIFSQKITPSEVMTGLRFFGLALSEFSYDQSGDSLPDIAVGSKGVVVLLRSKPVVMVEVTMSFSPKQIAIQNTVCSTPLKHKVDLCFSMNILSKVNQVKANINFTLTLDANRKVPNNRAFIREKQREISGTVTIASSSPQCQELGFFIEACPEDALTPLNNELRFTFEGLPSKDQLRPSLAQQAKNVTFHPLQFEINCGVDNECVDRLELDFNFTSSSEVRVGIDELLDVTVSVTNSEENSYNSLVILRYPAALSYRKFTGLKGRIECNSLDSEDGLMEGVTQCTIDKPIFRSNTEAVLIVSYGIESNREFSKSITISASATSQNKVHSDSSVLHKRKVIGVKYSIFVTFESSLSYVNFTFGKNDLQKPIQQSITVRNYIRAFSFTVIIMVPVKLGEKDIWEDSGSFQIPQCKGDVVKKPSVTDFVSQIQKSKVLDCTVATCKIFRCSRFLGGQESAMYEISANLSSRWVEQIGLQSAKFHLISTVSMEYDTNQYIFFSAGSKNDPPVYTVEADVEVYAEPNFTKEIVGGSLGGLALLALLTAGLYKAGFFKSKYNDMIQGEDAGAGDTATENAAVPEPQA
ncbi:integrin alpha-M-like isoform X2 [Cynoglossus semilaevis]|uniref:integrin alpha-M-like isoform X2 n=1 Tax=Cynoglossus semilaevis TaxID=244447 RepID=UPI000D629EB4|nr:integrin alpha-M-like isoform X2 [Cynoglossus semilaevis]